jgi:predicted house-cleaning noncanonical NTP pyrophosphatase (MazG superfamily)
MKRRAFLQNKLWRDRAVELMERTGSLIHWTRLDDTDYDKQLRIKLIEESQEVQMAKTREELCGELADLLEVIHCLCTANGISIDDVHSTKKKKQAERGSYVDRTYVTVAEHLDSSFGTNYCLADPEKYPEISYDLAKIIDKD